MPIWVHPLTTHRHIFYNVEVMVKTTPPHVGELEELMMLAVAKASGARGEAAGTPIREALVEAGRRVAIGTLYVTLERLESKGLIESRMTEATAERGGRAKRVFRLVAEGVAALEAAEMRRRKLGAGLKLAGGVA